MFTHLQRSSVRDEIRQRPETKYADVAGRHRDPGNGAD
ncbi:hypothetical protein, partial [Escherichia coli]